MANPINLKEKFIHLSKAPIVEATLEIKIVPSGKWNAPNLQNELKQRLTNYPKIQSLRGAKYAFSSSDKPGNVKVEDFGCIGFKLYSNDNLHIAQFNKDSFVFSRLKPYEDWDKFSREALQLLAIYHELLKPPEVSRIGLRFINRIAIKPEKTNIELGDFYKYPPEPLKELNWPLSHYLHHDVLQIPETSYSSNLIKTVQKIPGEIGLILDIDVFMQNRFEYNELRVIECLKEMRWIKNKIFFSSLTEKTIEELK